MATFIPQSSHLTEDTIITKDGDVQRTWKVRGISFETADPDDLMTPKEQMNNLLRAIGSSEVALWQHTCHRKTSAQLDSDFDNTFCRDFDRRYTSSLNNERLVVTELYLTAAYRPVTSRAVRSLIRAGRRSIKEILQEQQQAIKALDDIAYQIESSLRPYGLDVLGTYVDENNVTCSRALGFLNYLVSGKWQKVQLGNGPINEYLGNAWLHAGTEMIEVRTPTMKRFAQCLDLKEYSNRTEPGILNGLLYEGYEYVITQSFSLHDKRTAEKVLRRQQTHLKNTEDGSARQIQEIEEAIDALIDGQFSLGEYHFSMIIFGSSPVEVQENTKSAATVLENAGFLPVLATTATDAAWYAQIPCNWAFRPRIAHLTSRNFASLAGLHNFPAGKQAGNPWGDAVTVLKTPSGPPFFFNFHSGRMGVDQFGKKLLGNTRIIGQSGVGKTVLMNMLFSQSQKYNNRGSGKYLSVTFDIDEGAKLCILAAGGKYLSLKNGQRSGMNPFQMEPTESNILFLVSLVRYLAAQGGHAVSVSDERRISQAVETVMIRMPKPVRRLSTLLQNIPEGVSEAEKNNSIVKRLAKWCADDGAGNRGVLAWALDCETDEIDLSSHSCYGIDGTDFLRNEDVRSPVTMYLLHRIRSLMDGRRLQIWMDEGFRWLDDPVFSEFTGEGQATIRKKDGMCVFATQSPKTVIESAVASSLLEQIATEVYLPNPRATKGEYLEGFKVTEAEFRMIRNLPEDGHMFIVKQGKHSVVAWLDLEGFEDDLAILSSTPELNTLASEVIEVVGGDPDVWVPEFQRRRRSPRASLLTAPIERQEEVA